MDVTKEELTNAPTFESKRDQDAEKAAEQRRSETPAQRPMPGPSDVAQHVSSDGAGLARPLFSKSLRQHCCIAAGATRQDC